MKNCHRFLHRVSSKIMHGDDIYDLNCAEEMTAQSAECGRDLARAGHFQEETKRYFLKTHPCTCHALLTGCWLIVGNLF